MCVCVCIFVWLFDTDCCYIVFERLRFLLPFLIVHSFTFLLFPHPLLNSNSILSRLKSIFFLAFISFLHTFCLLWHCSRNNLFSIFCLHHFSLLFIFPGLLLFTVLALDHNFSSCCCLLHLHFCVLAWCCWCWYALVGCVCRCAHTYILIFFSFLIFERAFARFHVCTSFFPPFTSFSSSLNIIQIEKHSFFVVWMCVCVYDFEWLCTSVFQLGCREHTQEPF